MTDPSTSFLNTLMKTVEEMAYRSPAQAANDALVATKEYAEDMAAYLDLRLKTAEWNLSAAKGLEAGQLSDFEHNMRYLELQAALDKASAEVDISASQTEQADRRLWRAKQEFALKFLAPKAPATE